MQNVGNLYGGRDAYFSWNLSHSHEKICPKELFEKDSTVGLRDVILKVVSLLKKGNKVVVDDENAAKSTRQSYIKVIDKKIPSIRNKAIVKIRPKYGCQQIYWNREYCMADSVETGTVDRNHLMDSEIQKWYHPDDMENINYQQGIDAPEECEGFLIYEESLNLTAFTDFKFEIPALFMDWNGMIQTSHDYVSLHSSVTEICQLWAKANPWGRIIVICEESSSGNIEFLNVKTVLHELLTEFQTSPVYVLHVTENSESGSYSVPPRPGLIAFLQKRHCLDLQSNSTLFLYHHKNHMKMAEAAGVKYIKINKVLQNPSLVLSSHIATQPVVPKMLGEIELQPTGSTSPLPRIPLHQQRCKFKDRFMSNKLHFGRSEYIFAWDIDSLDRYQALYAEYATPVTKPGSKIQELIQSRSLSTQNKDVSGLKHLTNKPSLTRTYSSSRDLPKWMTGRKDSDSSNSSLAKSDSLSSTEGKIKHTVYVMTEKELVEIATDILKQAGREDILKQITMEKSPRKKDHPANKNRDHNQDNKINTLSDKNFEPQPGHSKQNIFATSNLIGQCDIFDSSTHNVIGQCNDHQTSNSTDDVIGQIDSDESSDITDGGELNCHRCDRLNKDATRQTGTGSKSKTAVLDSFMDENFTKKRSPQKRRIYDGFSDSDEETSVTTDDIPFIKYKKSSFSDQIPGIEGESETTSRKRTEGNTRESNVSENSKETIRLQESKERLKKVIDSSEKHNHRKRLNPDCSILDEIFN